MCKITKKIKDNMIILIDNGHGSNTEQNGKYSPKLTPDMNIGKEFTNGERFREWKYNRVISKMIVDGLKSMEYDARLIVPEDNDISLSERIKRINTICNKYGNENVILISVHSNAKGNGTLWEDAKGWEAYTTKGKTKSDKLSEFIYKRAHSNLKGRKIREDWTDGDADKESDFYIIKKSHCPAILTENFFYDNKDDLNYLTSDEGVHSVVRLHIEGIIDFINSLKT
jgi:N-acetylmuramoyl-L-alanine amidase